MAKVGPNAVNLAIAEMIGQLLTFTTHPIEYIEKHRVVDLGVMVPCETILQSVAKEKVGNF